MIKKHKAYALLMGANFETVAYLLAAWQGGIWLNENYRQDFDWSIVTYILCLILIGRSWYVIFSVMIKSQKESEIDDK